MLQNLSIQDFLLIEKLDLDFEDGFCVITGQTGAGKSILLDAILFALGSKASGEVVRANQEKAVVVLTFTRVEQAAEYLSEYDINLDPDDDIIIKRIQYANGRRKFLINDNLVTQKVASDLFDYLLEIHGQHNHTLLLKNSSHLEILDQSAGNIQLKKEVMGLYKLWQELHSELLTAAAEKEAIIKEIDYLSHMCHELRALDIKDGEEEELTEIKKRLQTREKEIKLIESILNDVEASNIVQIIAKAQRNISKSDNIEIYSTVNISLEEIYNKVEEAKSALTNILHSFDLSEHSLPEIEDRIYAIRSIARKHGYAVSELGNLMQQSSQRLIALEQKIKNSAELNDKVLTVKQEYLHKAQLLSENRRIAARGLEKKTTDELSMLDMKKALFVIEINSEEKNAGINGIDEVRFLASTNPGMPKAPIDKIASGGELSRFMLAFRTALFDKTTKKTIIFDEVDVGVSGSVADSVGERLKTLSTVAQVIVITHQPQVAGKANQHILVEKTQTIANTSVTARSLDLEERPHELARMISGKEITANSLAAAKELM
ncbi:MAG TPA: DNA repair protein RecN [Candidatus Megaira endosymbiont of Stentor roeselii]|nr:DNA repair protein RecN [Candidatus Megaera endosymbiont of Stentor roeselii]